MLKLILTKMIYSLLKKNISVISGEHLKKMMLNSDLQCQFINKESGNSMTTAKCQTVATLAPVYIDYKDSQITSLKLYLIVTHFVNFKHNFLKEI